MYLAQSCVFGKQLPGPILCASPGGEDPLSRSYGVSLPNSLTANHPSALVYSTRPRVSVYSTADRDICLAGFLGGMVTCTRFGPKPSAYFQVRIRACTSLRPSAPTPLNLLFRQQAAVSLPRHRVAPTDSNGILTVSSIGLALLLILRHRLTPGRLTSPGKPWSYGEGESHPLYRYLYLHLLFRTLHNGSRRCFDAERNAPLPIHADSTSSVYGLYPIIIHAPFLD